MKKLINHLIMLFLILCSVEVYSQQEQKTSIKNIPVSVQQTFIKKYPDLNSTVALRNAIEWKKNHGSYEAFFTYKGQKTNAAFDPSGLLKESGVQLTKENLPPAVLKTMNSQFKKEKFSTFSKISYPNGNENFKALSGHFAYLFNKDGRFIRKQSE